MSLRAGLWAIGVLLFASTPAVAEPELAPVWSDGAVIQRDRDVTVQGYASPGAQIIGTLGEDRADARADAEGVFVLRFPARPASAEPVALSVTDASGTVDVSDLLVGDVYLCSGQSNMAFTVAAGLNGYNNIQASNDPLLRMLTVPLTTSAVPTRDFGGEVAWQSASPETTGGFSAACYYMLRDLRAELGIPMGAIHSSWGGSQIRAWLTPAGGAALYGEEAMGLLSSYADDPLTAVAAFAPEWQDWYREASSGSTPWSEPDSLDWQSVPQIGPWTAWGEGAPPPVGNVWFRRTIELTAAQAAAGAVLNIGIIDDLDGTFVNGHPVGISHGWSTEREYTVPARFLRAGANEIVFAASNSWGAGGMQSGADRLSLTVAGERIALGEGWRHAASPVTQMPPRAPWDANAGIGVMHNRMVAPIGQLSLAGAAWYQGESDVGIPGYGDRLRELFAGWRAQFGPDIRMLVVQLANYGEPSSVPVASGWAELREVERQAVLADPNAAIVTAIDLGEWSDIHPTNKVLLGQRLALAALGEALPQPVSAERIDGYVRVDFSGVEGALESWSGPPLAFELCGETQESCRFAAGFVRGNAVLLPLDDLPVTRVRHGWADAPVVNTFDARNIALPGFELAVSE
ncbi:MAG: sialate O-acetylesterase [Erythrobacter sp.]|nr:MAG: sialate O-acetylesterase [Erythrobacter sp.]